jgi:multicomponent Na+:H+ antiporter subunit A
VQGGTLASQISVVMLAASSLFLYSLMRLDLLSAIEIHWENWPTFYEFTAALLAVVAAIVTVRSRTRLNAIISAGVVGVTVTLFFVFFSAPDLALTQLLIDVLLLVLLVLVFYKIPPNQYPPLPQPVHLRNLVVAGVVGLTGVVLTLLNLHDFYAPTISDFFLLNSVPAAHGANVVNVILVDFRGFDTLGEITVLSIAALGGYALLRSGRLRPLRGESVREEDLPHTDTVEGVE